MITSKRTAFGVGALLAATFGTAAALDLPRPPPENESVPQPPMMRAQAAGLPARPGTEVHFYGPAPAASSTFEDFDLNRDGALSPFEAGEDLSADFAAWDSDGDGKISRAEYAHYRSDRGTLARNRTNRRSDRF